MQNTTTIPKIIHYMWFGQKFQNTLMQICVNSWRYYNPDFEIKFWNEDNFESDSKFFKKAIEKKLYRKVSNYLRYKVLYEYGGIWVDTDIELLRSIEELLKFKCFFVYEDYDNERSINNAVMGSIKNFYFLKRLLEKVENATLEGNDDYSSGPKLITNNLLEIGFRPPFKKVVEEKQEIALFPRKFFYPLWYEVAKANFDNMPYAIHWGAFNSKRNDPKNYIKKCIKTHKDVTFIEAKYGHGNKFADVLSIVKNLDLKRGVVISNYSMKCDPAPSKIKSLQIIYLIEDCKFNLTIEEGNYLFVEII